MQPFRSRRLCAACPRILVILALAFAAKPALAQSRTTSGTVVDQDGRPVPRALVRMVDAGRDSVGVFADDRGRFELTVPQTADCRIAASLAGFETAEAPCTSEPLRLELKVGPIRESVIVTSTRTEAPASQVGASATVFTAEDLERRQVPFVADLVGTTPGAMMIRSGGPGTLTSLFVRGGESDYNKVLLDGIPLNEPGGTFYLNNLTTENLDRIEIVRGAYSSLYGSDAMASVIQLFTRRADGMTRRPRGSVQIDGGTYGTVHASASVAGATLAPRLLRRRRAVQQRQPRSEQQPRQHDAERKPWHPRWSNCNAARHRAAPSSRTSAHQVPRPSAGPISMPSSTGATSPSSVSFDQSPNGCVHAARVVLDGQFGTDVDQSRARSACTRQLSRGARPRVSRATFLETRTRICAGITQATRPTSIWRPRRPTAIIGSHSSPIGMANGRPRRTGWRRRRPPIPGTTSGLRRSSRCSGRGSL